MTRFRKGDVVSIECVVQYQYSETELSILQPNGYSAILIDTDKVTLVRNDIQVGDLIKNSSVPGEPEGRVLAIQGDYAWLETSCGDYSTWKITRCERVETSLAQVAA
ncbi:hypothetical protein ACWF50_13265 [Brucella pseudogrignonensis]